ncbi:aminoacyl-tRNA hydrolase [Micrococcus endophyticus]
MTTGTTLIVGLGNPGPEYERTRHNVGQMVVDELASRMGVGFTRHRAGAVVATGRLGIGGPRVVLAKSTGYMNVSGRPVSALASFYGIGPEDLVVVHDELDIPFDTLRLKRGGGEGGHNGLKSITASLGTKDYARVRVGIGRPPGRMDVADFVLRPFTKAEQDVLPLHVDRAADAVEKLVTDGLEAAQQAFH